MSQRKLFWGWYVVAGTFLIFAVNYGVRYSFGIFLKPMSADYGWARSVISIAASINMLVYSIGSLYLGTLIDKVAPRWIMTAGALLSAVGLILTAFLKTPIAFLSRLRDSVRCRRFRNECRRRQFVRGQNGSSEREDWPSV